MSGTAPERVLGAVLAGGASRRLGRDKSAERVGGTRMIDRAAQVLGPHCEEVVVVSRRPETPAGHWRVVPDRRAAAGPLAGIEAALFDAEERGRDAVFVLACDLPLVDESLIDSVLCALGEGPAAAPARDGEPAFEPLCSVYRVGCRTVASELLDRGERSARGLFEAVGGRPIPVRRPSLLNVNTEADLVRARAAVEAPDHEASGSNDRSV